MTDQQHPITPPPELVRQWRDEWIAQSITNKSWVCDHVGTQAARWGADQELEACCEWVRSSDFIDLDGHDALRAARRPNPPSLKEQALADLAGIPIDPENGVLVSALDNIRRALESLPE